MKTRNSLFLVSAFLFLFGTPAPAGIIDDAIAHCNRIRDTGNRDLPLPDSFNKRFQVSTDKALLQCRSLELTQQDDCKTWVEKITKEPPKTIFNWNTIHQQLVHLFNFYYHHYSIGNSILIPYGSELAFLPPSKEGEYCPVAVFDRISTASLGKAFANHVYPLGVSLTETTEYDGIDGDPENYFRHDLFHAGNHLTRKLKDHISASEYHNVKTVLNLFEAPLSTKELIFPPQHLQYLQNQRKVQVKFIDFMASVKIAFSGKACTNSSLFDGYYYVFHEGEDFSEDNNAKDIQDLDTACAHLNRVFKHRNIENHRWDIQYHSMGCVCNAWSLFQDTQLEESATPSPSKSVSIIVETYTELSKTLSSSSTCSSLGLEKK